jgi:polysaccharide export outer membrane protein
MSKIFFFVLSLVFVCAKMGLAVAADKPDVYRLHQGDTLQVSVWREDALQKQVGVLPDGSITFPLAGRVEVVGLSAPEAEQLIALKLKTFLPDPNVSVMITGIAGNSAYVLGKVMHPGPIVINGPLSVLQAISIAGGFDKFADEGGIKVIRDKSDAQSFVSVHYKDIISGTDMSTNIQLKASDTIVVP